MSVERVREHFRQFGIEDRMMEFEASSATVELAAQALGVEGKRIAKTLSFKVNIWDGIQKTLSLCAVRSLGHNLFVIVRDWFLRTVRWLMLILLLKEQIWLIIKF